MIDIYRPRPGGGLSLESREDPDHLADAADAVWIDLIGPTLEEETAVEALLELDAPTRDEMRRFEESSRLYREGRALVMIVDVLMGDDREHTRCEAVALALTPSALVSVRYDEPRHWRNFADRWSKDAAGPHEAIDALFGLLDAMVERVGRALAAVNADLDALNDRVFAAAVGDPKQHLVQSRRSHRDEDALAAVLMTLGRRNKTLSQARTCLASYDQTLAFLELHCLQRRADVPGLIQALARDVKSLRNHEAELAAQTAFLLDATLGFVNLQQNRTIKVLTVGATLFVPPTLVGTVYGMNFEVMPELKWAWGYPLSLLAMLGSSLASYLFMRWRNWM